jgi:hypothetical protein
MPAGKVIDRDRGMKKILRDLAAMDGWQVTIGIHGQESGRGDFGKGAIDNVALGAIHEFGAPGAGIPERSFLRSAFDANVKKYVRILLLGAKKVTTGLGTAKQAVALAGEAAVADVVNRINAGIPPPLRPATVVRKGSSKQLIDTGQLKASIKPVVTKK